MFVYTLWLKRSTPQNIVIGGAAGAVPPLVGWAAVTGALDPAALYLFAIVFYWTPPHFWALSPADEGRVREGRRPDAAGRARRGRDAPPDPLYSVLLVAITLLPFAGRLFDGDLRRRRRSCSAASSCGSRCGCSAAPTAAPRCASTSTRSLYLALLFAAMVADVKL